MKELTKDELTDYINSLRESLAELMMMRAITDRNYFKVSVETITDLLLLFCQPISDK